MDRGSWRAGGLHTVHRVAKSQTQLSDWYFHFQSPIAKSAPSEVEVALLCPTLCDPMDYIVHGILQARILEWVDFPFSNGSSWPRNRTRVSCIAGGFLYQLSYQGSQKQDLLYQKWVRTHEDINPLELKSNALTTRPFWYNIKDWFENKDYSWEFQIPWHFIICSLFCCSLILTTPDMLFQRKHWRPTPVLLPGKSQGRGSLVGCSLWGSTESDMTEAT